MLKSLFSMYIMGASGKNNNKKTIMLARILHVFCLVVIILRDFCIERPSWYIDKLRIKNNPSMETCKGIEMND